MRQRWQVHGIGAVTTALASAGVLVCSFAMRRPVLGAQVSKSVTARSADKPAAGYQVDVRLEVAPDVEKTRVAQWVETLRTVGVAGVSEVAGSATLRAKNGAASEPAVRSAGSGRVVVRAQLGPAGNLFIGPDAFRPADRARLEAFVKKLQGEGAPVADPTAPLWGLSPAQFELLQTALRPASNFALREKPLNDFMTELRGRTKLEIQLSPDAAKRAAGLRLSAVTGRLSMGAALAFVLGQNGLAFEPRQRDGTSLALYVLTHAESKRPWPVGMEPEKLPGSVAPSLLATVRPYRLKDMALDELLSQYANQLKLEVLLDRATLDEHKIDPDKLRSTIEITGGPASTAIRKTLAPLGLKYELRIDEADQPFLWITVGEPTGPPPKKKL